jgi:hypothetical protein
MTTARPNWRALFREARKLIENEVTLHENSCGCQDVDDGVEKGGVVEGPCPGLPESKAFLKKTAHLTSEKKG